MMEKNFSFTKENLVFTNKYLAMHDPILLAKISEVLPKIAQDAFEDKSFPQIAFVIDYSKTKKIHCRTFYVNENKDKYLSKVDFYLFCSFKEKFELDDVIGSAAFTFRTLH